MTREPDPKILQYRGAAMQLVIQRMIAVIIIADRMQQICEPRAHPRISHAEGMSAHERCAQHLRGGDTNVVIPMCLTLHVSRVILVCCCTEIQTKWVC